MSFPPGVTHSTILYGEAFVPGGFVGSFNLAPNLDTLGIAAKSVRIVLAINLEWQ